MTSNVRPEQSPAVTAPLTETPLLRVRKAFLEKLAQEESLPEAIRSELAKLLAGGTVPTEAQVLDIITRE